MILFVSVTVNSQSHTIKFLQRFEKSVLSEVSCQGMKRDRIQIMSQIMALCCKPSRKTRIMYQTNLSYPQLKTYLTFLSEQELIAYEGEEFKTTQKGQMFLEAFNSLMTLLEDQANHRHQL